MKKILLIALIITALTSCKKDGTKQNNATVTLVGKWNYKSQREQVISSTTGSVVSDETTTTFPSNYYLQYNADGTGTAFGGNDGSVFTFTYSITGNLETEYQTPKFAGDLPYTFSIVLTSTSLSRHSQSTANGFTHITDEVLIRQ